MSTEQRLIFDDGWQKHPIKKRVKKCRENLSEVQQQNRHGNHMLRCDLEFCHNQPQAAFTFGKVYSSFRSTTASLLGLPSAGPERRIPRSLQ